MDHFFCPGCIKEKNKQASISAPEAVPAETNQAKAVVDLTNDAKPDV